LAAVGGVKTLRPNPLTDINPVKAGAVAWAAVRGRTGGTDGVDFMQQQDAC
jgi:hypothetical protein